MLITPVTVLPPPQSPNQPEAVANGLHNVQVQAVAPITANAITPAAKDESSDKAKKRRKDDEHPSQNPSGDTDEGDPDNEAKSRGENLNLSV